LDVIMLFHISSHIGHIIKTLYTTTDRQKFSILRVDGQVHKSGHLWFGHIHCQKT